MSANVYFQLTFSGTNLGKHFEFVCEISQK